MRVINISFLQRNRLYFVVGAAIFIGIILIYISFNAVMKIPDLPLSEDTGFVDASSYYAEFEVTDISNKNRNMYTMKEWYKKVEDDEHFKFMYEDFSGSSVIYFVSHNRIQIINESQINSYVLESNNFKKSNLFSLATYSSMIKNADALNCITMATQKQEEGMKYILTLNKEAHLKHKEKCPYLDIFSDGLRLSKLEIYVTNNKPTDILAFQGEDVCIDIKYTLFELNKEIADTVFSF